MLRKLQSLFLQNDVKVQKMYKCFIKKRLKNIVLLVCFRESFSKNCKRLSYACFQNKLIEKTCAAIKLLMSDCYR